MPITLNGTTGVTYPDGTLQTAGVPAPGTAGNVLTSNGTSWVSQAAAAFDAGTAMIFAQTSAPTGWTKSTTHDNKALRVVSGTAGSGGSVAFTTAFASQTPSGSINVGGLSAGATTLSTTQIPSHTHSYTAPGGMSIVSGGEGWPSPSGATTGATGGGGSHTHSISGSATFTGNAINLAVQYVDVIIAIKN